MAEEDLNSHPMIHAARYLRGLVPNDEKNSEREESKEEDNEAKASENVSVEAGEAKPTGLIMQSDLGIYATTRAESLPSVA